MKVNHESVVQYILALGDQEIHMNDLLGKKVVIRYLHQINCIACGRLTSKSFAQGYCYPCFISSPETEECVLRPELCRAHLGIARDMEWSEKHCLQEHIVYLALSSDVKVGVTRKSQVPIRWIDQGAWKAIRLAATENRYQAGLIEVALKQHMTDKTNWQHMLKNVLAAGTDLLTEKEKAIRHIPPELNRFISNDDEITEIHYPVLEYPQKVKSFSLDDTSEFSGLLTGIKGQYLIFSNGQVINIRKHGGYLVELECL
ncbi:MAG: DUF2797 domain-containing protein [Bacteroidia bacterium]|nr:DUF2797 domain-containing protein [Bacteroidia bacterium]